MQADGSTGCGKLQTIMIIHSKSHNNVFGLIISWIFFLSTALKKRMRQDEAEEVQQKKKLIEDMDDKVNNGSALNKHCQGERS